MQLFNSKTIKRLLALIMIVVLALGCFVGCSGSDGGKDDDDEEESSTNSDKVRHEWNGLIYYLGEDYELSNIGGDAYATHRNGTLTVIVADLTTPDGVTDSESYAQHYADEISASAESVSVKSKNNVYYIVCDYGDGTKEARAFYVAGDHCWMMYITSYDYDEYSSQIVSIVTSAKIDEDYQYNADNNSGNNSDDNSGSSGTPSTPNTGDNSSSSGSNSDNSGNNSGNSGTSSTPNTDNNSGTSGSLSLVKHEWDGLTYYLRDTYSTTQSESSVMHASGTTVVMVVSGELQDSSLDAEAFAQLYVDTALANNFTSQRYYANGVYYAVTDWNDGTTEVRGFYAYNGYGWCIYGTTYDYDVDAANLITYVTSGEIDKNYQHSSSSGSGSSSNTTTDGTVSPNQPTVSDQVTVYAYVPYSWGTPGLWAWQDGGENAYDSWPGETMIWNGSYYTATAPAWIDHIVLNGNGGSIQTDDVPVDSGIDLWIVIHADGAYFSLFYSEPTSANFEAMGY